MVKMLNMINNNSKHSLDIVRCKLFVIGFETWEVFDNNCKKFVALNSSKIIRKSYVIATSFENKITVLSDTNPYLTCYNVDRYYWSRRNHVKLQNDFFSYTKILWC